MGCQNHQKATNTLHKHASCANNVKWTKLKFKIISGMCIAGRNIFQVIKAPEMMTTTHRQD